MGRAARLIRLTAGGPAWQKMPTPGCAATSCATPGRAAASHPMQLKKRLSTYPFRLENLVTDGPCLRFAKPHSGHRDAVGGVHTINHARRMDSGLRQGGIPGLTVIVVSQTRKKPAVILTAGCFGGCSKFCGLNGPQRLPKLNERRSVRTPLKRRPLQWTRQTPALVSADRAGRPPVDRSSTRPADGRGAVVDGHDDAAAAMGHPGSLVTERQ